MDINIYIYISQRNAPANSTERGSLRLAPTTVQCSICSQLNNKPRVVVTDFRLYHTCSIIASKASFLVSSMARIFYIYINYIYIFQVGRTCMFRKIKREEWKKTRKEIY